MNIKRSLTNIILSGALALGAIGCSDKKVESMYNPETFPKADSVVFDSNPSSKYIYYSDETFFRDKLKIKKNTYKFNGVFEELDTVSVTRWFYDNKRREARMEYDILESKGLDQVENTRYNKDNEWIRYVDYEADNHIELIVTSPEYK
mgnify:CR=1 FL=1